MWKHKEAVEDDDETVAGSDSESESEEFQVQHPPNESESESKPESKDSESESDTDPAKLEPDSTPRNRLVVVESSDGRVPKKAKGNESESESDPGSENDEDSESESAPAKPDPKSTPRKRPVESSDGRVSKKAKGNEAEDDKEKKQLIQRIWSDYDAVALLKCVVAFKEKKRVDPVSEPSGFRAFLNKSLHSDFETGQVMNKIRSLKSKFRKYARKELGGHEMVFRKASDIQVYKLSREVWGMDGISPKKNDKENKDRFDGVNDVEVEQGPEPDGVGWGLMGRRFEDVLADDEILKNGWKLVAASKRAEIEKRWKELKFKELDLFCLKAQLTSDQVKAVLEAVRLSHK